MFDFKLSINLTPSYCNSWPHLKISSNDVILYNDLITEDRTLTFNIRSDEPTCLIQLDGIKKNHDTILDRDGNILKDKFLRVNSISINDINMGEEFIRWLDGNFDNGESMPFLNQTFFFNGSVSFNVRLPILDWIIESKYIAPASRYRDTDNILESRFSKFKYDSLYEKISKIESLLNDKNSSL